MASGKETNRNDCNKDDEQEQHDPRILNNAAFSTESSHHPPPSIRISLNPQEGGPKRLSLRNSPFLTMHLAQEKQPMRKREDSDGTENLVDNVGKPVFHVERIYDQTPVGVVMGLAWTALGGSIFYIETIQVEQDKGKGNLTLTRQLGDLMKECAQVAHTAAIGILAKKDRNNLFFRDTKLHLDVPPVAMPKDGSSAICTMITSLLSLALNKPVKKELAMAGEVTLNGQGEDYSCKTKWCQDYNLSFS